MDVNGLRLVSLVSSGDGDADGPCSAFLEALRLCCDLPHVTLVDGRAALAGLATLVEGPVVLLNADRAEVMDLLAQLPLAAAVERYSLFAWWKHHRHAAHGFWLHGHRRVVERMTDRVVMSPLYTTEKLCAFGSESLGLPALLARYLGEAATTAQAVRRLDVDPSTGDCDAFHDD